MLRTLFFKDNAFYMLRQFQRGYKFQVKGIIPGGGLGKLQGIKEEEYFSRQDHKMLQNMKDNFENSQYYNVGCIPSANITKETSKKRKTDHRYTIKHKILIEEAYFLNEHCDSIQVMKARKNREDDF